MCTSTVCSFIFFKHIILAHTQYSFCPQLAPCGVDWQQTLSLAPLRHLRKRDWAHIQTLPTCPKGTPRALIRGCRRCCARIPTVSASLSFLVLCLFLSVNLCLLSPSPSLSELLLLHHCLSVYLTAQVCLLIFFLLPLLLYCALIFFPDFFLFAYLSV